MKTKVRIEKTYPHRPERVWRALTDPVAMSRWLMQNDFAPRVGHRFQFRSKPQRGWRGIVDCEVTECEPPKRLTYTWLGDPTWKEPTIVTWTLEPDGTGTRLTLLHDNFLGIGGWALKMMLGAGWRKMLTKRMPVILDALAHDAAM